jgi:hypothetical protein
MKKLIIFLAVISVLCADISVADDDLSGNTPSLDCKKTIKNLKIDGAFNEKEWAKADWHRRFFQKVPVYGEKSTEKTEVAFLYDSENLYVAFRCFEEDPERIIATRLRHRDNPRRDDFIEVVLDTYNDKTKGYLFTVNPLGAREEAQLSNSSYNWDWNEIWEASSLITKEGWQVEIKIPLKILRFAEKNMQVWGVNARRMIRHKREDIYLVPPDPAFDIVTLNYTARLSGLRDLNPERNIQVKPYLLGSSSETGENEIKFDSNYGADLKYAVNSDLTLDVTANTDFAQVESDSEQVNLSRFSLFYPEKREFFLENAQLFNFRGGNGEMPFFSRQIGMSDDEAVPIDIGARLSGKVGDNDIGFLSVKTAAVEEQEIDAGRYTVLRLRHNLQGRSYLGGIFTDSSQGELTSRTYGVDGKWFFNNYLSFSGNVIGVDENDLDEENMAMTGNLDYTSDPFGFGIVYNKIGKEFDPDLGYVRRKGFENNRLQLRRSVRTIGYPIRRFSINGSGNWLYSVDGPLESSSKKARVDFDFESGERFSMNVNKQFERLFSPFSISDDITFIEGDYSFTRSSVSFSTSGIRRWRLSSSAAFGKFYDGDRTDLSSGVSYIVNNHLSLSASTSKYQINTSQGDIDWQIWKGRINYTHNANLSISGLVQYNSATGSTNANLRLRLIHKNDSDLFIVLNERRYQDELDRWHLENREGVVKVNYRFFL